MTTPTAATASSGEGPSSLLASAVRNNAEWCAAVCRTHGVTGRFGSSVWSSAARTPPYYPDAVTLLPGATPDDVLPHVDHVSPGCTVKDCYATLDLAPHGFTELFAAQWIHRAAPVRDGGERAEQVLTHTELAEWRTAWGGGVGVDVPDIFRPALLDDPAVVVLALREGERLYGGSVLSGGAGVVGVSNLFATDAAPPGAVWAATLRAAAWHFPGLDAVGYEQGDDLAHAGAAGFRALGRLRVWLHGGGEASGVSDSPHTSHRSPRTP
ncbi:hypothetical protein [Streptomyces tsukubensis]|uniref:Uncharacterized protein n=1 Tax=Streptomyces tsukubensis TaxID=83656 RepID=A0A1V4A007_9ACTN|nr:hypothetical protein [Streptomyces tsukubensis]OON72114.1 hypothetical protein B1H18_31015 [Streptomyces tsukubensis]